MALVVSGKIARCDWLLTWRDFSVMTAGIMKIVNALLMLIKKNETKNTEMSDVRTFRM